MGPVWLTTHKDLLNSVYATWTLRIGPMALGDENGLWCYNFVFEDIACGLFIGLKIMLMMAMMMLVVMMMPRKMMMMPAMV